MENQQFSRPHPKRRLARPIVVSRRKRSELGPGPKRVLELLERNGPKGEIPLRELRGELGVRSLTTISQYIRKLREAGLVDVRRRGRNLPNEYELQLEELTPA